MNRYTLIALACVASLGGLIAAEPQGGASTTVQVKDAGKPAFALTLPAGWTAIDGGTLTVLRSPTGAPHVELWATDATTVKDAAARAAALVGSKVTDFTPATTDEVTIAAAPALTLSGPGTEADDGDPANARVTFFTLGGRVWVLCSHGEGDGVDKQRAVIEAIAATIAPLP